MLRVVLVCTPNPRLTVGGRHAETDLCHEPEPGRLHRRVRRRPRLERAERRAVPVVVRPGGGDGPGAVRAQTVADNELPLADRRPAAWRHTGAAGVRPPLAGHAEPGGDPDVSRRRAPDQVRDQALNTLPRIGAGSRLANEVRESPSWSRPSC